MLCAVIRCRTAQPDGHVQKCDDCGHKRIQYNSCRNRHCPKCQGMARAVWLEKRESELLPIPYFHVVFTLPHELGSLALQNKRVVYGSLFRAAAQMLLEIAADPKHLGAKIGFRGKFIDSLKRAFRSGKLEFHGHLKSLGDKSAFEQLLNKAVRHDWIVYVKRPFSSPACVLKYLTRYTHRVAISNRRLVK